MITFTNKSSDQRLAEILNVHILSISNIVHGSLRLMVFLKKFRKESRSTYKYV
jgi:hypothetical protein